MPSISAVIITNNEARNIGRCLASLEGVVDEIVVVDSGSTDETPKICRRHGAIFIAHTWEGYAANKNFANAQATHPYILSLDADEALSDTLRMSVLREKEQLSGGYRFNRFTNYCGHWVRYCGWYPDPKVRLFPREKAQWKGDYVHEILELDENVTISNLAGDLLHYTCYTIDEHIDRVNRYTTLAARHMLEQGKKAPFFKIVFSPWLKFFQMYILKRGFLDGWYGYIISRISAQAVGLRYAKLRQLWQELQR